jgi:hypothetical protein
MRRHFDYMEIIDMSDIKTAGARLHAQEGDGLCGAAVGLTILSDSDVGGSIGQLNESTLFDTGHGASGANWFIDPHGLIEMLTSFKPPGSQKKFFMPPSASELKGTSEIVSSISSDHAIPPAVLIYDGRHWVSVNSIEVDGDPRTGDYTLFKLWIYDPYTSSTIDSRHSNADDCVIKGIKDQCVFYPDGWRARFTSVFLGGVDVFPIVKVLDGVSVALPHELEFPDPILPDLPRDKDGLIKPEAVDPLWQKWQEIFGDWPSGSDAAARLTGSVVSSSFSVEWLGRGEMFRLAVLKQGAEIVGSFALNARTGRADSVNVALADSPIQQSLKRLDDGVAGDTFIWKPCLESFSLHMPFRGLDGGRIQRIDGRIFPGFTTEIKGA